MVSHRVRLTYCLQGSDEAIRRRKAYGRQPVPLTGDALRTGWDTLEAQGSWKHWKPISAVVFIMHICYYYIYTRFTQLP